MHGKTSLRPPRRQRASTTGVPQPFTATRYHSLAIVAGTMPPDARRHEPHRGRRHHGRCGTQSAPIYGVQFHPESVLTEGGYRLLGNWLETVGIAGGRDRAAPR